MTASADTAALLNLEVAEGHSFSFQFDLPEAVTGELFFTVRGPSPRSSIFMQLTDTDGISLSGQSATVSRTAAQNKLAGNTSYSYEFYELLEDGTSRPYLKGTITANNR